MERGNLTGSEAMTPEQNDVFLKRYTGAAQDHYMPHTSAEMMTDETSEDS